MSETLYLNPAGTSWPKPPPVLQAVQEVLHSDPADWAARFEADHARVAAFFGLEDPSLLLPTPGCTSALAVAVADLPWRAGDRVLISGREHLALERPVRALAARGVEVVVAPEGSEGTVDLEAAARILAEGGVRLVAFSAACNVTGDLAPMDDLVQLAHAHGALALVDGAQIGGWWDLDLPALGADLFTFAGHKGLQAPWGIGGLYVRPGLELVAPRAPPARHGPGYCDVGSVDRAGLAALAAATQWLRARPGRLEAARAEATRLRARLSGVRAVTLRGHPRAARMPKIGRAHV